MKIKLNKKIRNDIILFVAVLTVAVLSALLFNGTRKKGDTVNVIVDGETLYQCSLNESTEKVIKTEYGTNTVVVNGGRVFVKDADCPDGICENHRAISKDGETIVCLPHKLTVEISGEEQTELDAVV